METACGFGREYLASGERPGPGFRSHVRNCSSCRDEVVLVGESLAA